MSSVIDHIIPKQNFEKIIDQIVLVLSEELANQHILAPNPLFEASIYKGRFRPIDKTEIPAIVVYLSGGTEENSNADTTTYRYTYNIEVYTSSKDTNTDRGDTKSSVDCEKLIGVIRYILEDAHYYQTLGVEDRNIVSGSKIESINTIGQQVQGDGINMKAMQIVLGVTSWEQNGQIDSTGLTGADASMNDDLKLEINK